MTNPLVRCDNLSFKTIVVALSQNDLIRDYRSCLLRKQEDDFLYLYAVQFWINYDYKNELDAVKLWSLNISFRERIKLCRKTYIYIICVVTV